MEQDILDMAPLPDNDKNTANKNKEDEDKLKPKEPQKDEKTLSNLNDRELKALLDEAINYKNPKDREGKSELFNDLLLEAEETERIARATSAGGSELVRHCNPAARRQRHSGGPRGRRYAGPSSSGLMGRSVTERGTHGGSLDNLAKEELYEATCRRLRGARKSSTSSSGASSSYGGNQVRVSARQREGGSLPSNVNSGETSRDFLEEAKRSKEMKDKEYVVVDMDKDRLENDLLARGYEERFIDGGGPSKVGVATPETHISTVTPKYTSKATLHIQQSGNRATNVDDPLPLELESTSDKNKLLDASTVAKVIQNSKCQVIIPAYPVKASCLDEKKVDENGNALHQTKEKKKKKQSDKNVVVLQSENIEGHKSEIINNVDQLLQFIEGTTDNMKSRVAQSKSKQLHKQHASEDGGSKAGKKRHTKSSVKDVGGQLGGDGRHELKVSKSNSLGEISGMKLDRDFEAFSSNKNKQDKEEENVVLRGNKSSIDRARERRSWGNVEPHSFQALYNASSLENLETSTDTWEVTRPKKKSKKRRNSVSSASGARQNSSAGGVFSSGSHEDRRSRRAPTPDLGAVIVGISNAKTTQSMPHSEKSNDSSSDVDSVHSLPMDGPISYADIAKNSEKKKPSPEKQERSMPMNKEKSPQSTKNQPETDIKYTGTCHVTAQIISVQEKSPLSSASSSSSAINTETGSRTNKIVVPDVNNIKSFPAITGSVTKTTTVSLQTQNSSTSDKAVQSTLSYEDSFVREKSATVFDKNGVAVPNVSSDASQPGTVPTIEVQTSSLPPSNSSLVATGKRQGSAIPKEKRNRGTVGGNEPVLSPPNNSVQGFFGAQSDVSESFFSQFMRDSAQYATQRMPPDIMEVSAIEKIQLMNCSSVNSSCNANDTPQSSTQVSYTNPPSTPMTPNATSTPMDSAGNKGKRKKVINNSGSTPKSRNSETRTFAGENVAASVCDTNLEERGAGSKLVNGICDELPHSSSSLPQPTPALSQTADSPPPVVILSGLSKEVPSGLVFGFDINEQLLLEDCRGDDDALLPRQSDSIVVSEPNVSENDVSQENIERSPYQEEDWVRRYKPPPVDRGPPKHNHDKIVNFILTAWESVLNQQIPYYSDSV
ncbi:serine-rich adhesin for platelets-like isoform X3 [Euwallacea fornicatus]|uniref:serine-rich adhesin for platelets-like isoform X3 n=1 Tax=Euwallacea fornicatus TaxID=995702 RepID=UPI00338F27AE